MVEKVASIRHAIEVHKALQSVGDDVGKATKQSLQSLCCEWKDFKTKIASAREAPEETEFKKWLNNAKEEFKPLEAHLSSKFESVGKTAMDMCMEKLGKCEAECAKLQQGATEGTNWRAGLDGASFLQLQEVAKKELLLVDYASTLKARISALSKVGCCVAYAVPTDVAQSSDSFRESLTLVLTDTQGDKHHSSEALCFE
eukprot:6491442-Amphidinium_carterae.1